MPLVAGGIVCVPKLPWSRATKAGSSATSLFVPDVGVEPMKFEARSRKMSSVGHWIVPATSL